MNSCFKVRVAEPAFQKRLLVPALVLILASCAAPIPSEVTVQSASPSASPEKAPQVRQPAPAVGTAQAKDSQTGYVAKPTQKALEGPELKEISPESSTADAPIKPDFAWIRLSDAIGAKQAASLAQFIRKDFNVIEAHDPQLLDQLQNLWGRVEGGKQGRMSVLHFGDSHVQGGMTAQIARHVLQEKSGNAGRGMVFPYAIAKTYSQNDYKSSFLGEWVTANSIQVYPKLPLGVSGFVAHTKSAQAGFTLDFARQFDPGAKRIQLMYRATAPGYTLRMKTGRWLWESKLASDGGMSSATKVLTIEVPQLADVIQFELIKPEQSTDDDWFELHGLNLENQVSTGAIYHNLGVGGAAFASLLAQQHFETQSALLKPDLVILDWGTNDLIYKNQIPAALEKTVVDTIERVRVAHPQALILLTSVQDTFFRKKEVTATHEFAHWMRKIARENHCLFYDWHRIAGGRDAMRTWYAFGLAQPDHVHLSSGGYAIKGELLAEAILNAIDWRKQNPKSTKLWLDNMPDESNKTVAAWLKSTHPFESRPDLIKLPKSGKANIKSTKKPDQSKSKSTSKSKAKTSNKRQ